MSSKKGSNQGSQDRGTYGKAFHAGSDSNALHSWGLKPDPDGWEELAEIKRVFEEADARERSKGSGRR